MKRNVQIINKYYQQNLMISDIDKHKSFTHTYIDKQTHICHMISDSCHPHCHCQHIDRSHHQSLWQTQAVQSMHLNPLNLLSVRTSVLSSVCPSVLPSVQLSVCPSVRLSVCPSVRLSVRMSYVCPFICLVACPSSGSSVHLERSSL